MRGMKLDVRSALLLLPLLLSACAHKTKQAQIQPPLAPPIEDAPPSEPDKAPSNLPPSVISAPQPDQPAPAPAQDTAATPSKPAKPSPKHKKPVPKPAPATGTGNPEQASNGVPEVSAIGQLSSGEPSDLRQKTSASIADTERRLNAIQHNLNDQEQKTSTQIREFLKQAKAALASGDADGAYTLALKAKVLLGELSQ